MSKARRGTTVGSILVRLDARRKEREETKEGATYTARFAAVGRDDATVWGMGATESEALEEGRRYLREAAHGGAPGYLDTELEVRDITPAQALAIDAGEVKWATVAKVVDGANP